MEWEGMTSRMVSTTPPAGTMCPNEHGGNSPFLLICMYVQYIRLGQPHHNTYCHFQTPVPSKKVCTVISLFFFHSRASTK